MRAAAAALLALLALPAAGLAETDAERGIARERAAGLTPLHELARQHQHRAIVPCDQWGQMAALAAHERNLGHSLESRLRGLGVPGSDPTVIATAQRMARDLWARPNLTPPEAWTIAYRACGWPR